MRPQRGGGFTFSYQDDMDSRCKVQLQQKAQGELVEYGCPHLDKEADKLIGRL